MGPKDAGEGALRAPLGELCKFPGEGKSELDLPVASVPRRLLGQYMRECGSTHQNKKYNQSEAWEDPCRSQLAVENNH